MSDFNAMIIDEFRSNAGHVETGGFGDHLVLVHSVGSKSGAERINPLFSIPVDDSWLVAASAAGAPKDPAWFGNLVATPDTTLEVAVDGSIETVTVRAEALEGAERDEAWAKFTGASEGFQGYESKAAPRVIPVVRLRRRS